MLKFLKGIASFFEVPPKTNAQRGIDKIVELSVMNLHEALALVEAVPVNKIDLRYILCEVIANSSHDAQKVLSKLAKRIPNDLLDREVIDEFYGERLSQTRAWFLARELFIKVDESLPKKQEEFIKAYFTD